MDAPAGRIGISEPVPSLLARVLKHAVVTQARHTEPVEPLLHVGIPGQHVCTFEPRAGDQLDLTLRTEILEAMASTDIGRRRVPLVWLTRDPAPPGALDQEDLAWAAAATCASDELEVRLDLVVITRTSWRDPRSGVGRTWKRIRPGKASGSSG